MSIFTIEELEEAKSAISSLKNKCEKSLLKLKR